MTGPLSSIRVVDLTSVVSGPVATGLLADQGADVIKVESLTGDLTRRSRTSFGGFPPTFIACNRGKRAIALDLKHSDAAEVLWRLIDTADVLVQNFRPGAIERLGFGEADVRARRPQIVYLSISGVGENGPYAKKRVYDPVVQALSGMADVQADPDSGRPRMIRTLVADKTTGIYAAQAITAALVHKERTGEGQHVRLSMLDTMISYIWPEAMAALTVVDGEQTPSSSSHDMIFKTADGYITIGAVSDAEWRGLCDALDKPKWLRDPRFLTPSLRNENRQVRLDLVADAVRNCTSINCLSALDVADVPCAPVLRRREVLDHPQVIASKTIETIDHPDIGRIRQARPAARFEVSPAAITGPAPKLGQHTREVLLELGYSEGDIAAFLKADVVAGA